MKKRILFVDDEPSVLQGLRRALRTRREEWDMAFAQSGGEALEILAQASFDVIVSDIRMPGMNGAQLLAEVKKRHPTAMRIVLSGHSDQEMILKSVPAAHQYLSKPCAVEILKSTVDRACALRSLPTDESLRGLVSQADSIPSLPSIYGELLEESQSPGASVRKVGQIIAKDMGMTAKVLQLVNSAFFGIPRDISDPLEAVSLLGLNTVLALTLTGEVFSKFDQSRLPGFPIDKLWNHSMKTGKFAREIAKTEKADKKLIGDTFMAALLHDVGKLVLAANLSGKYSAVMKQARDHKMAFHEAEQQTLGATHARLGAYLLGMWGLPANVVEAVAFHHDPGNCFAPGFTPLAAVHVANTLEHLANNGNDGHAPVSGIDPEYLDNLGLAERLSAWQEICRRAAPEGETHE